ncbi:MAG: N-6 DNA methylase [Petrimonas sp.]|nr:N-6 DNA methylase [Petrimonas sp.]
MTQYTNIMQYESDIWAAADLLIAAGIKQSKFPDYMMPYFAVMLLESRMLQVLKNLEEEGYSREDDLAEYVEAFKEQGTGYNEYIVKHGKKLSDICKNDTTFKQDWSKYLKGFDSELKMLLGVERGSEESKYLNISGVSAELEKKGILFATVAKWSEMDFTPFDNSEITTLEEHIKRKWADISAETAGEQYTPSDIISLIAEIVGVKVQMPESGYLSIYDPTCGGGNLLFGVADKLKNSYNTDLILTRGCDFNDTLYALASIESRFRDEAEIVHGNTLTKVPYRGTEFNVVVANPPYGVSWKGYRTDIERDQTGQFIAHPSVSDGQLLFMQHIMYQLNSTGMAVEVHNGSTLFSGDAGGGESNIRKYMFDNDWVEAIIQMPSDEFFNTGIYTYLWVMNKNKPADRKDRVILINGSNGWKLLKKSRGSKRREMLPEHRQKIVDALLAFEDCDIAKVFSKWHFYYNKQGIRITEVDSEGKSVLDTLIKEGKTSYSFKAKSVKIDKTEIPLTGYKSKEDASMIVSELKSYNFKEDEFKVITQKGTEYWIDSEMNSIYKGEIVPANSDLLKISSLGCGTFNIKTAKNKEFTDVVIEIVPVYTNDYEIIPYSPNEAENDRQIADFMARYVSKPFEYRDNVVGVELNFNKEFYMPETVESVDAIIDELIKLQNELKDEKFSFNDVLTKGLNPDVELRNSEVEWLGEIPKHWEVKRVKEISKVESSGIDKKIVEGEELIKIVNYVDVYNNQRHELYNSDDYMVVSASVEKIKSKKLKKGDILITPSSETVEDIGVSSVVMEDLDETLFSYHILRIQFTQNIDINFKKYVFNNTFVQNYFSSVSTGTTRKILSLSKIYNLQIPIPPLPEQVAIAKHLDRQSEKIDRIVENINAQLGKLAQLKKSLINECVTGEREVEN